MFTHLFEPIMIGPVEVPNRICHVPTDISSSRIDGSVSERDIAHHGEIAKGGTGFIVVGATSPDGKTGRSTVTNLVIDDDSYIPGFARLAACMHRYGARCAVQLQHPGRQAALPREGKLSSTDHAVKLPWSQSREIVYANADVSKKTVHFITTDEIIELVDKFFEEAGVQALDLSQCIQESPGAGSYVPEAGSLWDRVVPFEENLACPRVNCEFHPKDARKPRKLEGDKVIVWGDHVVTCWTRPHTEPVRLAKKAGLAVESAGDAVKPRNLHAAVKEGAVIGLVLDGHRFTNPNNAFIDDVPIDIAGQLTR
jgi:hypothetical protein